MDRGRTHGVRQCAERGRDGQLTGRRCPANDRGGRVARLAILEEGVHELRKPFHRHVQNQCPGKAGQQSPVEGAWAFPRVLVPGDEGHGAGVATVRERNARTGRGGQGGGDAGDDLVSDAGLA